MTKPYQTIIVGETFTDEENKQYVACRATNKCEGCDLRFTNGKIIECHAPDSLVCQDVILKKKELTKDDLREITGGKNHTGSILLALIVIAGITALLFLAFLAFILKNINAIVELHIPEIAGITLLILTTYKLSYGRSNN